MIDWRKLPWSPYRRKTDERRSTSSFRRSCAQGRETAPRDRPQLHPELVHRDHGDRGAGADARTSFRSRSRACARSQSALWLANIALFALFSLLYAARWVLFPREAALIFRHPVMSMFFGAIPMGLATIVNGFLAFGPDFLGAPARPSASRALFGRRTPRCRSFAASPSRISCSPARSTRWRS